MRSGQHQLNFRYFLPILFVLSAFIGIGKTQPYNESKDFSYAMKLYNEGFYDIAVQQFSSFVNRYAQSSRVPEAKFYLANSLFKLKEYRDARVEYQSLAVSFPDNSRAAEAWEKVGDSYRMLGSLRDAAKSYETVKMLFPKSPLAPAAYLNAGNIYLKLGDYQRAEKIVRDFLDRYLDSPQYPAARLLFGKLLLRQNKLDRAANELSNVLELSDDSGIKADARLVLASVYRRLGLSGKAEAEYRNVLQNSGAPERAFPALVQLTNELLNAGKYDESLSVLGKYGAAYKSDIKKTRITILRAKAEFLKGDFFSGRTLLSAASDKNIPDSLRVQIEFYKALNLSREGKSDEALALFRDLTAKKMTGILASYRPLVLQAAFETALKSGKLSTAGSYLDQLTRQKPEFSGIESLKADYLIYTMRTGKQVPDSRKIDAFVQLYPESPYSPGILFAAGKAFFRGKEFKKSRAYFQQILKEFPASGKADSANAYINFIETFRQPKQNIGVYELARLLEKFLLNEDRMKLLNNLGAIYFNDLQNYREAARVFSAITRTDSDSSTLGTAYFYLSRSLIRQLDAGKFLKQAIDSGLVNRTTAALQKAMEFIKFVPEPDRLTFDYLSRVTDSARMPTQKLIEFWQHFVSQYQTSSLLPGVLWRLSQLSLQNRDSTAALHYLKQLIAVALPSGSAKGTAYWEKAKILAEQGQTKLAETTLKEFLLQIPADPKAPVAYRELAQMAEAAGDYSLAAQFLEKLKNSYAYTKLAQTAGRRIPGLYIKANQAEKALKIIRATLQQYPEYPDPVLRKIAGEAPRIYFFYEGKGYFVKQEWDNARKSFLSYLNRSSKLDHRGEALYLLGTIAARQNDSEGALLQFSLVPADDAYFVKASASAAEILYDQRKFADARRKYDSLIPLVKNPGEKLFYRGQQIRSLINEKKFKLAQNQIQKFKNQYKRDAQLKNYLASFEFELGKVAFQDKNFISAVKHMNRIIKKYKKSDYLDDAEYYLGLSYSIQNQNKKAEQQFTRFLKSYPNSPILGDVYVSLGNFYFRQEKADLAIQAFRNALKVSDSPHTRKAALTSLTRIYQNLGQWDATLQVAREYVRQYPQAGDVMDKNILIGISLTNLNRFNEAVDFLKKIRYIADSNEEPEIQFYIGQAYFNAGQYEKAITEFVKIPLLSKRTKLQWEASALYYSGQGYEKLGRKADAIRMYQEIVNRPGILIELKREARKRIAQLAKNN